MRRLLLDTCTFLWMVRVCQALVHGLAIVTPDPLVAQYPARVLW